ncbi:chemosensory receptor a [Plakobranchus ocellatus]|uniref:Chemosensory receptor a n=1 Tax=Plakobranchus ocellatus TaxID=259542 RepID=A0AAV4A5E7_9GAST|nr:chemosensory receptor a [Plakobranchus ocellatus]
MSFTLPELLEENRLIYKLHEIYPFTAMSEQEFGPEFNISATSFACDPQKKPGNSSAFFMMNETSLSVLSNHSITEWFARDIFENVISVMLWFMLGIGIMGMIGNILTITVYIKLGFSETIHMSYLALAVSDLCTVITTIWCGICYSPLIDMLLKQSRIVTELNFFANFTCFWPHVAFSKTTALITAWISLERCLCVVFPIKVKLIITRLMTKIVLLIIFIIGCGPVVFAYTGRKSEWRFDPKRNQTRFFMFENGVKDLDLLNRLAFSLYSAVYPVFSWVSVILCTTFLIIKLRQSATRSRRNVIAPFNEMIHRNQDRAKHNGISIDVCFVQRCQKIVTLPQSMGTNAPAISADKRLYRCSSSCRQSLSIKSKIHS